MPNLNPGPGEYKVLKTIGHDKPMVKFKGVKCWQLTPLNVPSPAQYQVNSSLTLQSRHNQVTMSKKLNYDRLDRDQPGSYFIKVPELTTPSIIIKVSIDS